MVFFYLLLLLLRDLLETAGSDREEKFPMKTYVINVPNVGPYVVMVRPDQKDGIADAESTSGGVRPVFPGSESVFAGNRGEGETESGSHDKIEIVPYKKMHFLKSWN